MHGLLAMQSICLCILLCICLRVCDSVSDYASVSVFDSVCLLSVDVFDSVSWSVSLLVSVYASGCVSDPVHDCVFPMHAHMTVQSK